MTTHARHILNPIFLTSLTILLLNDHILKEQFPNWLTGKLSDVFGIVVFVQLLNALVKEKFRKSLFLLTAFTFVLWKSELSSVFIDLWNSTIPYLKIQRVVDYTDLICLIVLIPLYKYKPLQIQLNWTKEIITYPISAVTIVAILATSRAKHFNGNDIFINDFVKLKMDRNAFLNQLTKDNILYTKDSTYIFAKDTFDRYVLNNIIINLDTIHSAKIGINDKKNKIEVYIENLTLSKDWNANLFKNYKELKKWRKKYRAEAKDFFDKLDE